MRIIPPDWSERHKLLSNIIRKRNSFSESIDLTLSLHSELHASKVSGLPCVNNIDLLFKDMLKREYEIMPSTKDETIAWAVWHIARIEDLTMNILADNASQVFDASWKQRLNVSVSDTGNAMTDEEIFRFSREVRVGELLAYRDAVGMRSREILRRLSFDDMKRKAAPESLARILAEGGVTRQQDSIWLLDFWGKKDVAGIILMPLTRHQTLHLNDCDKWKEKIRSRERDTR